MSTSTTQQQTAVHYDKDADGIVTLTLDDPTASANTMNEIYQESMAAAVQRLYDEVDSVTGVVIASAKKTFFAGGNLKNMVQATKDDAGSVFAMGEAVKAGLRRLEQFPRPVVAAVNGAAVAGGCILALAADHRVLRRGAPIGLNEVKVGVPLPWSVTVLLRASVPASALGRIALLGRNFTDDEALAVGLADEIAAADGFEEACLARLAEFTEKDARALATTKRWLREPMIEDMKEHEPERVRVFLDGWFSPATQQRIRATVASLSKKG
jgi:3-hydroxyacyl-CoA dehydrogenase/enoyl-CoA hydratase/3-hydroxybutyryl-CoA epimerase